MNAKSCECIFRAFDSVVYVRLESLEPRAALERRVIKNGFRGGHLKGSTAQSDQLLFLWCRTEKIGLTGCRCVGQDAQRDGRRRAELESGMGQEIVAAGSAVRIANSGGG